MYKRILDHLNAAILLFDRQLILIYINNAGEILLADSAHHLIGQSAFDLFKQSDPAVLINVKQSLTMGESFVARSLTLNRPTQNITVNLIATPMILDE